MISISGYQFGELIHESGNSLVYRGWRRSDNQPVILKILKDAYPSPEQIVSFKSEYDLIRNLNLTGVVQVYTLERNQQRWVMVLEDFGGHSLSQLNLAGNLTIDEFLPLAIEITHIVGRIHQQHIIHKDLNPSNILVVPPASVLNRVSKPSLREKYSVASTTPPANAKWVVKLIDFGISTKLSRENPTFSNPDMLEGTLAYISPEQTGRMNRAMDYRTDFYSLGATFYQLLTGRLPFPTGDALELVHAHIAKQPPSPKEIQPDLPTTLSDIVMRLMAKNAEDRYQSAYGLKADLEECLEHWQKTGEMTSFPLGRQDISDKLQIPQKLYGRQAELEQLLTAFERVSQKASEQLTEEDNSSSSSIRLAEIVLVSGVAGIGKSKLVRELHKPVTRRNGSFVTGKFDRLQSKTPYSPLIQALRSLIQQLLMQSEAQVAKWRQKLQEALGVHGQILFDVIPEMSRIMGQSSASDSLEPTEAQNRFPRLVQNVIKVFAQPEHPLVIFLDDLQWVDESSLKLIETLVTSSDNHALLIVGSYRDRELEADHPLLKSVAQMSEAGVRITQFALCSLELPDIIQWVADTFYCDAEEATPLAEVVFDKTNGNPFFMGEFVKSMYAQKLINFEHQIGQWQWKLSEISTQAITDNVVQLMADKVAHLSSETQELIKLAACIGHQFDLETLAVASENEAEVVAGELWAAISEGLILLISRTIEMDGLGLGDKIKAEYRFSHDRVQQAIYALIPETERQTLHWRIGQLMLRHTLPDQRQENIFELVNQLNLGRMVSVTHSEWDELAELNLLAGRKAKATGAYQAAAKYLKIGIELLNMSQSPLVRDYDLPAFALGISSSTAGGSLGSTASWQRQYALSLALYEEATEIAYLNSNFQRMDELADTVLQNAKSLLDKIKTYEIKMRGCIAQNKLNAVIQIGLPVLRLLGVHFPRVPNEASINLAVKDIETALAGRSIEVLANQSVMTDPLRLAAMRLLAIVSSATYLSQSELMPLVVFKMVTLCIEYGNAPESALAYAAYGLILCGDRGNIEAGYQFGKLALQLREQLHDQKLEARTLFEVNTFISHWKDHIREGIELLLEAYRSGLETGDLEYAARAASIYDGYSYLSGRELAKLEPEMAEHSIAINELKQERAWQINELYRQAVLSLMQPDVASSSKSITQKFKNSSLAKVVEAEKQQLVADPMRSTLFHFHFNQLIVHYLCQLSAEHPENEKYRTIEHAQAAERYLDSVKAMLMVPVFYFYDSLVRLAVFEESPLSAGNQSQSPFSREQILQKVAANQQKMKEWMQHAPANYLHKFYLVEAEYARVLGRSGAAREYYDKAIASAQENHYLNEEALAYELATQFYLAKGQSEIAQIYLQKAHYTYTQWGAKVKARQIKKRYPEMLTKPEASRLDTPITTSSSRTQSIAGVLDLTSVIKASQAISGEIMLDTLLAKMMKIVIENAGAERGVLILDERGEWVIEAEGSISDPQVTSLPTISIGEANNLPFTIINYVDHTHETVVLQNAAKEGPFVEDPYIKVERPKSVLCTPLIHQRKLIGLLYLENNLTTDAFTPARLEVLNLLSSQAAISIQNARFYAQQLELTKAYSRFVPRQILNFLNKESILDVKLGDQIQQDMTVLFSDIRSFTTLSEQLTPQENFKFINSYLGRVSPIIRKHNGFIDKFIGDAIMALFPESPTDALKGAIAMHKEVIIYNGHRANSGYAPISIGAGLHTGNVMLGTVGEEERMEGTVISDTVNLAARLEGLTKMYGAATVISEQTLFQVDNLTDYQFRFLDKVKVKGKKEPVAVFEILDGNSEAIIDRKLKTQHDFEKGLLHYHSREFEVAQDCFQNVMNINPDDKAAQLYLRRIKHNIEYGVPVDWEGIEALTEK